MVFLVHHVVSYSAFSMGFLFNGLLIFLIHRHTIAETRTYAEILISTCVMDMIFITIQVSIQPIYGFNGEYRYLLYAGPLVDPAVALAPRLLDVEALCNLWILFIFASPTTLSVQFIFRYLVMCRGKIISSRRFFIILGAVSLWMVGMLTILENAQNSDATIQIVPEVLQNFSSAFGEPRDKLKVCWIMSEKSKWMTVLSAYIGVCVIGIYTMMVVCGWRIWRTMNESLRLTESNVGITEIATGSANNNVDKWASGNGGGGGSGGNGGVEKGNATRSSCMRQLANTLIMQGLLPFFILLVPNAIFFIQSVDEKLAKKLAVWTNLPYSLPPVVDPLITIFVVKSYRQAVLRLLRIKRIGQSQKLTISQCPVSTVQMVN